MVDVLEEFGIEAEELEEWVAGGGAGDAGFTGEGIQVLGGELVLTMHEVQGVRR